MKEAKRYLKLKIPLGQSFSSGEREIQVNQLIYTVIFQTRAYRTNHWCKKCLLQGKRPPLL